MPEGIDKNIPLVASSADGSVQIHAHGGVVAVTFPDGVLKAMHNVKGDFQVQDISPEGKATTLPVNAKIATAVVEGIENFANDAIITPKEIKALNNIRADLRDDGKINANPSRGR